MDKTEKPFLAAYHVLKILREEGVTRPGIFLYEDGSGFLALSYQDYNKFKQLAENLLLSDRWFNDLYGNYCLSTCEGLTREDV